LGIDAVPLAVVLDDVPVFVQAPKGLDIRFEVGTGGRLIGGVLGPDLIVWGVVDVELDGTPEYSGTLLTGEILQFGYLDTGTSTDYFDMLFRATGGALLSLFDSDYIAVTVVSANSTFTGTFAVPFSGGAAGNIGPADVCTIQVQAIRHTVGTGSHPNVTREPIAGLMVGVYDASDGGCARAQDAEGDGISHQEYPAIVANCVPKFTATTDENGTATFLVPPGDYVIIGGDGTDKHLGVSAGDCLANTQVRKFLREIVRADAKKVPGKTEKHRRSDGSELRVVEPEYIVWDDSVQLYPFIFETEDEFGVVATVTPPEGFVADYDSLSTVVQNETEALQFTITEVGSDLVPTVATFEIVHNGRVERFRSHVGIRLTAEYARRRGFDVRALRARGLIIDRDRSTGRGPAGEHGGGRGGREP